jgi:hypothetical protein
MKPRRNPDDLAVNAIKTVMAPGLTGIAFVRSPLTQTARARPLPCIIRQSSEYGRLLPEGNIISQSFDVGYSM